MHLAFLTSEYPHSRVNKAAGIGTSIKNLVEGLAAQDVEVSLFIYQQNEDAIFTEGGINFHLIKKRTYPFLGWYRYRKFLQHYLNKFIIQEGIDAIEAPDWTGITAFMRLKAPLVIRFHGSDTYFCQLEGRKQKWKNRFFEKNAIGKAVAYIAPTTYAGRESARLFGVPESKVATIHYGLNLDHFVNEISEDFIPNQILYIGTIIRKKGVFQLAEMFSEIVKKTPEAQLILIGADSPDRHTGSNSTWELLQQHFSEPALQNVQYLGKVPYATVKEHIKTANVCVFPSLAETLGMVTIESMALKKAVVNTNYGWAEELIDHGVNGFKIDPNQIQAYADIIVELMADREQVLQLGIEARKKIEQVFDIHEIVAKNIKFYEALLNR